MPTKEDILLEEYRSLRQEIQTSLQGRHSVLAFGVAAIGAFLTTSAAGTIVSRSWLSLGLLGLGVPLLTTLVLRLWHGEYCRSQNAGKHLVTIERKINQLKSSRLLTWEQEQRTARSKEGRRGRDVTVTPLLFLSLAAFLAAVLLTVLPMSRDCVIESAIAYSTLSHPREIDMLADMPTSYGTHFLLKADPEAATVTLPVIVTIKRESPLASVLGAVSLDSTVWSYVVAILLAGVGIVLHLTGHRRVLESMDKLRSSDAGPASPKQ